MTPNPVVERRYIFFHSARVILNDTLFLGLLRKKEYPFVVALSQHDISVPAHVARKHKQTVNIDLRKTPEEILQCFHATTRNEVRRSFSMPELSITRDDERFNEVYAVYKIFRKEKRLPVKSADFLRQAMRMGAYWQGELLSVITWYDVAPVMRIQHIFSKHVETPEERKRIGYATRRLVYEICAYGSRARRDALDMASVNFDNPAKRGITAFKMSFGGSIVDEYIYTYNHPLVRFLAKFL